MSIAVLIVHLVACAILILVVLLQTGKGASMGAAFGGSSQTVFGSAGAATFLSKLTTAMAVVFMLTSLGLAMIGGGSAPSSVMQESAPPAQTQEAAPAAPAPATTEAPAAPAEQAPAPAEAK